MDGNTSSPREYSTQEFINTLFDPGQQTCYAKSAKGYRVMKKPIDGAQLFCINALHPTKDLNPRQDWHKSNKARRDDKNVVCLRNFLIELDDMNLDSQIGYVRSELPVTSITYSGGKSYHFIISLTNPCETKSEYDDIANKIFTLLPKADRSCKNPSRFSRLPGAIRSDTNKLQELVLLSERIDKVELLKMLPDVKLRSYDNKFQASQGKGKAWASVRIRQVINPDNIAEEIEKHRGRDNFFYYLGNRITEMGASDETRQRLIEIAYDNLPDNTDFTLETAIRAGRGDAQC